MTCNIVSILKTLLLFLNLDIIKSLFKLLCELFLFFVLIVLIWKLSAISDWKSKSSECVRIMRPWDSAPINLITVTHSGSVFTQWGVNMHVYVFRSHDSSVMLLSPTVAHCFSTEWSTSVWQQSDTPTEAPLFPWSCLWELFSGLL